MNVAKNFLWASLCALPALAAGGNPDLSIAPLADSWPTFSGDHSGKRYSPLNQITPDNVKNLTLAWATRLTAGMDTGGGGMYAPRSPPQIVGGEAAEPVTTGGLFSTALPLSIRGAILEVNGVLYASAPDNAWAIDARSGAVLWHYYWKSKGGTHTSNRGMGIYGDWLYFETADDYLVSLDAHTGKERWHKVIASFPEQYFSEAAPIIIENHVLVGSGNDGDEPGSLSSLDPATGELQWKFHSTPMNPGDPGADTWPGLEAARHGGGNIWTAGSYDPETRLYIVGTGNPTPAWGSNGRRGDNLFTCSVVAIDIDTGKMAWYYQTSPHDTHDWDSSETPILVDGPFNGKPRKLVLQGARNGHFFVLDRVTGEHLLTTRFTPVILDGTRRSAERSCRSTAGRTGRRRPSVRRRDCSICANSRITVCSITPKPIPAAPWGWGASPGAARCRSGARCRRSTTRPERWCGNITSNRGRAFWGPWERVC
jgi:alcohol dehydrogenase (cytochrome c)